MAVFLGPWACDILVCVVCCGSCVGGAGALARSLCISSKGIILGFVGGAGLG